MTTVKLDMGKFLDEIEKERLDVLTVYNKPFQKHYCDGILEGLRLSAVIAEVAANSKRTVKRKSKKV